MTNSYVRDLVEGGILSLGAEGCGGLRCDVEHQLVRPEFQVSCLGARGGADGGRAVQR